MLTINIKTGGSAYRDENGELDRTHYELRKNLSDICEKLEYGYQNGNIIDTNGNKVGSWSIKE